MSLRFIFGRSGSGKSHFCFKDIKRNIDEEAANSLILLVPEQFTFQSEVNLLNILGERGGARAEVVSFRKMCQIVIDELGGGTKPHLDEAGKSMLIYKILEENSESLKIFKKASKSDGFIEMISKIISEFKNYTLKPENIEGFLTNIKDETLKAKMEDLLLIYSSFEKKLHESYIDADDDLTILSEKLDKSKIFDGAEIWIDEFSSFTPQEYKILEKLLKKSKRVNITLCSDECSENQNRRNKIELTDVFMPVKNTEERLMKIITENNIKYEKPIKLSCDPPYRFKASKELYHLEKNLFSFPYKPYKEETKDISLFRAINKYSEVEEVAKTIIRLSMEENVRYKDITVVTGDLEGYESLVRAVFSEYKIPFFIDRKREVINNSITVLILSALQIVNKNYDYEAVFRYLKTGLIDISFEEIDLIENYVLANGIKGSKQWTSKEDWVLKIEYSELNKNSSVEEENMAKINEIRRKIIEPLMELSKALKGRKKGRDLCRAVYDFLYSIKANEKIELLIEKFNNLGALDKGREYTQIWNILMDTLDQVVEILGEEQLKKEQFYKILETGLKQHEIGVIPPSLDGILVGNITRVRSHKISHLFVLGVNDGVFPSTGNNDTILSDNDRIVLNDMGIDIAKDNKSLAFEEQFLIYTTLTTMNKALKISFPLADGEGKSKRPSMIISRLKKIFPNIKEESNILGDIGEENALKSITNPYGTFNELIAVVRGDGKELNIEKPWIDAFGWFKNQEEWKGTLDRVLQGFKYINYAEIYNSKKARELYGKHLVTSVSKLEKYASCPFGYFIQYGMNAKERKVYKLSPPDMGSFMHEVLNRFSNSLKEENLSWAEVEESWCEDRVSKIVGDILGSSKQSIFNSSNRYKYVAESIEKILKRSINLAVKHIKKGSFMPEGYEISFGINGDYPSIKIQLHSTEEVSIIGRVDRVDKMVKEEEVYLRVIDYKSGQKEFKLSDVYHGLQMQLLVYLDAILTSLSKEGGEEALPGGILYFKLNDPIIKTKGEMSNEDIEKEIIKSSKMSGLLINSPEIIKEMDKDISGYSNIIPVAIKVDGNISEAKSKVATIEQFKLLRNYVKNKISSLCEEMLEGKIEARPYKTKNGKACDYCLFDSICQFDLSIEGNSYKCLKELSDEEVWGLVEKEYKGE